MNKLHFTGFHGNGYWVLSPVTITFEQTKLSYFINLLKMTRGRNTLKETPQNTNRGVMRNSEVGVKTH